MHWVLSGQWESPAWPWSVQHISAQSEERLLTVVEGSNPSLLSPGLWSPSPSEKQAFWFLCLCCQQWSHADRTGTAPDDLGDVAPRRQAETYEIRQGEQKGNKRFQRALLPLSLVTVDSFTVINSLTSSSCDKWGRTDWTWWLIYQWIASFPFKRRPHWWSLWFSTTSWEGLQPGTALAVLTSPPRNTVWDIVCSFNTPGGNRVCKLQPTPQALYEEKKPSPPQPLAQMTVIRESHH